MILMTMTFWLVTWKTFSKKSVFGIHINITTSSNKTCVAITASLRVDTCVQFDVFTLLISSGFHFKIFFVHTDNITTV